MHRHRLSGAALLPLLLVAPSASAATFTVGPAGSGAQYAQLRDVFAQRDLAPGDIVLVRGGASYGGDVKPNDNDDGAPGNPVVIRWDGQGGSRPLLSGGVHTVKFERANHVVFEGFEVTGGTSSCIFSEAHDITVRDSVIHHCPAHGIIGADHNSGSFTLEYSEIHDAGSGTQRHPIYMASDAVSYPGSVFRMRFNYLHHGNGGNLVKSRHERNEIHYNWLEGAAYQALELIGPDCESWGGNPPANPTHSDIVGNVIVHTGSWNNVIRAGGDLNGRSQGRVRLVNNTILVDRVAGGVNAVYVQLGLESLELHNNAIFHTGTAAPAIVRENTGADTPVCGATSTQPWTGGRKVFGTHNWVESGATQVPVEWGITHRSGDPGFDSVAQRRLRPVVGSLLIDNGIDPPPTPPTFPFPSPLPLPLFDPPLRSKLAVGAQRPRTTQGAGIDVGALEMASADTPWPPLPDRAQPRTTPPGIVIPDSRADRAPATPLPRSNRKP